MRRIRCVGTAPAAAARGPSNDILTRRKGRNKFCLNEAFRPFLTRFFTVLFGAQHGPLKPGRGASKGESLPLTARKYGDKTWHPAATRAAVRGVARKADLMEWVCARPVQDAGGIQNSVSRLQGVGNV